MEVSGNRTLERNQTPLPKYSPPTPTTKNALSSDHMRHMIVADWACPLICARGIVHNTHTSGGGGGEGGAALRGRIPTCAKGGKKPIVVAKKDNIHVHRLIVHVRFGEQQ